jgi:hypothetical protein
MVLLVSVGEGIARYNAACVPEYTIFEIVQLGMRSPSASIGFECPSPTFQLQGMLDSETRYHPFTPN